MVIYVLSATYWGGREEVLGAYSTLPAAKAAMEAMGWGDYLIYTRQLDAPAVMDDEDVSEEVALKRVESAMETMA